MRSRLFALAAALLGAGQAAAHPERPSFFPDYTKGSVPEYRKTGKAHIVCKSDSKQRIKTI